MTELQKLGLQRVLDLAKETGEIAIKTTTKLMISRAEFNADEHTYPISQKTREIEWWADALLEDAQK